MRLRPRHYVLFLAIVAVFVYNIVHNRRPKPTSTTAITVTHTGPRPDTPAWTSFDQAASLRDAPDAQFQPALADLHQHLTATPTPAIDACLIWLEFYRHSLLHPTKNDPWKSQSQPHIEGCTTYHADTAS